MNLNFSISELIKSDTAIKQGIKNLPNIKAVDNLLNLIFYTLQPVRELKPSIKIKTLFIPVF